MSERPKDMLADELRTLKRTKEEERLLDEFEEFRKSHPVDLMSLFGIFKPRRKGVSLAEMEEAIQEGAAEELTTLEAPTAGKKPTPPD